MFSSPASTAVISLAFGHYFLEPFFIHCEIPKLAIQLITAVGLSEYEYEIQKHTTKMFGDSFFRLFTWSNLLLTSCSFFAYSSLPNLCWKRIVFGEIPHYITCQFSIGAISRIANRLKGKEKPPCW